MFLFLIAVFVFHAGSANILGLDHGDDCTPLGGGQGTCKLLSKCDTVGDFKNNHPPICRFNGTAIEPTVCCPKKNLQTTQTPPGLKVRKVCIELRSKYGKIIDPTKTIVVDSFHPQKGKDGCVIESLEQCGFPSKLVGVGGTEVQARKHPYMALIGFCNDEKKICDVREVMWGCGGSLITPRYVLSAAHCATPYGLGPARWARLGDLDISTSRDDAKPVDKYIVEVIVYPKYSEAQVYHDIALFFLDSEVVFNGYIMPACLHADRELYTNKANWIGWGRTGFAEATSDKLLEGEIDIYNDTECRRLMFSSNSPKTPQGLQPDIMICAGVPDGSKDACTGDSGGPLIAGNQYDCLRTQIGITSYGNKCGLPDSPGIYTRLSNYISWIEEVAFKDVKPCE